MVATSRLRRVKLVTRPTRTRPLALFVAPVVFLVALVPYWLTLSPTISWRNGGIDSGELVTAMLVLGIPHPTGYPLYMLLGKLFTFLPFGEPAWRVDLMSACFAALAVALIAVGAARLAIRLTGDESTPLQSSQPARGAAQRRQIRALAAGAAGALVFAFSPLLWTRATIAKEYTLNVFVLALAILFLIVWRDRRQDRLLFGYAITSGIGLGNHLTSLSLVPGAVLFLLLVDPSLLRRPRLVLSMAGAAAVGLLSYAYLPLRASQHPFLNWGDPSNWHNFYDHVSGAVYRGVLFQSGFTGSVQRFIYTIQDLPRQFGWLGVVCLIVGIWVIARRDRPFAALAGSLAAITLTFAAVFPVLESEAYVLPAYLAASFAVGIGFDRIAAEVTWLATLNWRWPDARVLAAVVGAAVILPAMSLIANHAGVDLHTNYFARDYAVAILNAAEPHAVVLTDHEEETFSLWYAQGALHLRPDVVVIDDRLTGWPWYRSNLAAWYPDLGINGPSPQSEQRLLTGKVPGRAVDRAQTPDFSADRLPSPLIKHVAP